jgi:uncharacterized protein YutE (UPF0331/DUF86 family)
MQFRQLWDAVMSYPPSPFQLVALLAGVVIVIRMIFPAVHFDNSSLALFGIGCFALVIPSLIKLLPPLKKINIKSLGEAEFDATLDRRIGSFEKEVRQSEKEPTQAPSGTSEGRPQGKRLVYPPLFEGYVRNYQDILRSSMSNREKILSASVLAEQMIFGAAKELEVPVDDLPRDAKAIMTHLRDKGFVTPAEYAAFDEFWGIRNLVIHESDSPISDYQTTRVLDLLYRLVKTFG